MSFFQLFDAMPIIQRLGWTLLHSLWQGGAIALVLAATLLLTRSPRLRYAWACAALLAVSVAAAITFALGNGTAPPAFHRTAHFDYSPSVVAPGLTSPQSSIRSLDAHDLIPLLAGLWMIGVVGQAIRQCIGWLRVQRFRRGEPVDDPAWLYPLKMSAERLHIRRVVRLVRSAHIDVPAVLGFLRPVILVPMALLNDLSVEQARAVLTHELAHIHRCDYAVNLIQTAIETIFFHHPAVWWISAQIRRERENCCDDIAASICGGSEIYAGALVRLEERRSTPFALAATDGSLLRRIRRLLGAQSPRRLQARLAPLAVIALVCVLVPLGLQRISRARADNVPTTTPSNAKLKYTYFHVTIGDDGFISVNGGVGDWQTLHDQLARLPVQERAKIVISLSAETEDLPVGKYFEAEAQGDQLVKDLGLAYLSNTGVERHFKAKSKEVFIGGDVPRVGVYEIATDGAQRVTVRQLIIAAGGIKPEGAPGRVDLIRRSEGGQTMPLKDFPVDATISAQSLDLYLQPGDTLYIRTLPRDASTTAPTR